MASKFRYCLHLVGHNFMRHRGPVWIRSSVTAGCLHESSGFFLIGCNNRDSASLQLMLSPPLVTGQDFSSEFLTRKCDYCCHSVRTFSVTTPACLYAFWKLFRTFFFVRLVFLFSYFNYNMPSSLGKVLLFYLVESLYYASVESV